MRELLELALHFAKPPAGFGAVLYEGLRPLVKRSQQIQQFFFEGGPCGVFHIHVSLTRTTHHPKNLPRKQVLNRYKHFSLAKSPRNGRKTDPRMRRLGLILTIVLVPALAS